ncbi:MAG TPA: S8 family serine peptidase [Actinophytocola sp.]|jgi:subtilisin family serine protease|nr:S8 family serine peptidase [Actinophytocola sp.]
MEARRDTRLDSRLRNAAAFARSADRPAGDGVGGRALDVAGVMAAQGRFAAPDRTTVKLLVRSGGMAAATSWCAESGGEVLSAPGDAAGDVVLLADVPVARLSELDGQAWLRRAEAPKELYSRMDRARGPVTGLDATLAMPDHAGLTGAGVLVAVVDSGVDYTHPDFRHTDGTTRLERFLWARQADDADTSQVDVFDATQIDKALGGGLEMPAGDPGGHGTHCASIAAGNGLGLVDRRFRGVAPEAALFAMRSEPLLDVHTIRGIREAFELAGDRPCVLNLSSGTHFGAHDGTSALENEIARTSGPGRIFVVAAGNEGGDGIHASGRLAVGQDLVIPFRVADTGLLYCDVWIPRGDVVDVFLETPDGQQFEPGPDEVTTPQGTFVVDFVENPLNRDQNLTVLMVNGRVDDRWSVRIRPIKVLQGEVHAWAGTVMGGRNMFPGAPLDGHTVGIPASEERAITVGSLVSRTTFEGPNGEATLPALAFDTLSTYSSQGPTRIGGLKPDIVAPGQVITAALSAGSEFAHDPRLATRLHPSGKYLTIQGTSMATPFVCGLIALMLQQEPTLTPEDVQQRMRITARRDAQTGQVWNPRYGWGKLDAQTILST